jgi:hypothetical protein
MIKYFSAQQKEVKKEMTIFEAYYVFFGGRIRETLCILPPFKNFKHNVLIEYSPQDFVPFGGSYLIHKDEVESIIENISEGITPHKVIVFPQGSCWELGAIFKIFRKAKFFYLVPGWVHNNKIYFYTDDAVSVLDLLL